MSNKDEALRAALVILREVESREQLDYGYALPDTAQTILKVELALDD